ncbi:hypothetical protein PFUGPA_04249 [Plasmodium falciparum Palo Alto/Uganda]|uniref:SLC26A/SulP transporter domain-containing protein n=1 Tax=Plasmodium falciparum (isolate Palo Alto / Uganda) TaxID=57270 RepID=W4IWK9_PLAFP|nr:hypothetical protein PFUGPA_04249 [Plasmodium falciparum Palo Alto/Uganda]
MLETNKVEDATVNEYVERPEEFNKLDESVERTKLFHNDVYDNDIKICLPTRIGFSKAFMSMVDGIKWGWGFTNTPKESSKYYINEILCGCILCLTMLPEMISFCMIAKIPPYLGLQGASFLSLITSIFGGSPAVIHGVTGAFASVCSKYLVENNNVDLLPDGIERLYICIFICSVGQKIPSSLIAITVTIFVEFVILRKFLHNNFASFKDVKSFTVGDMFSFTSDKAKPTFLFTNKDLNFSKVEFNMDLIKQVANMFTVLLVEALMVSEVIKDMGGAECDTNETIFSLFIGNVLASLGSAVGGSSLLGLSVLNYRNGARGKESGVVASILIYAILLFGYSLLNYIPLSFLCGIMITVFIHCFKWFSIPIVFFTFCPGYIRNCHPCMSRKISRWDAFIIVLVTVLCVFVSVPNGVLTGIILSALVYVWQSKSTFKFEIFYDRDTDTKVLEKKKKYI